MRQAAYLDMTYWHSIEDWMPKDGEEVIAQIYDMRYPSIPETKIVTAQYFETGWELKDSTIKKFEVIAWVEEPLWFRKEKP